MSEFTFSGNSGITISGGATEGAAHSTCNACASGVGGGNTPSFIAAAAASRANQESQSR